MSVSYLLCLLIEREEKIVRITQFQLEMDKKYLNWGYTLQDATENFQSVLMGTMQLDEIMGFDIQDSE